MVQRNMYSGFAKKWTNHINYDTIYCTALSLK